MPVNFCTTSGVTLPWSILSRPSSCRNLQHESIAACIRGVPGTDGKLFGQRELLGLPQHHIPLFYGVSDSADQVTPPASAHRGGSEGRGVTHFLRQRRKRMVLSHHGATFRRGKIPRGDAGVRQPSLPQCRCKNPLVKALHNLAHY